MQIFLLVFIKLDMIVYGLIKDLLIIEQIIPDLLFISIIFLTSYCSFSWKFLFACCRILTHSSSLWRSQTESRMTKHCLLAAIILFLISSTKGQCIDTMETKILCNMLYHSIVRIKRNTTVCRKCSTDPFVIY